MSYRFRNIAILTTALAFAMPAVAFAAPSDRSAEKGERHERGPRKAKKNRKDKRSFPIKGETFMSHVSKRISKMEARMNKRLEMSKLSDEKKAAIKADFNKGSAAIRSAAQKAASDGTVTRDEAKAFRDKVREVRKEAREKHGHEGRRKGERGKGKRGKGKRSNRA